MLKLNCSSLLKLMPPEMPLIGSGTKGLSTMVQPFPSMPTNIHPMYLELEDTNEEQLDQTVSEAKTLM